MRKSALAINSLVVLYTAAVLVLTIDYVRNDGGELLPKFLLYSGPLMGIMIVLAITLSLVVLWQSQSRPASKKTRRRPGLANFILLHLSVVLVAISAMVAYLDDSSPPVLRSTYDIVAEGDREVVGIGELGQLGRLGFVVQEVACLEDQDDQPTRCLAVMRVSNQGREPIDEYTYHRNNSFFLVDNQGNHYGATEDKDSVWVNHLRQYDTQASQQFEGLQTQAPEGTSLFGQNLNPGLSFMAYAVFDIPTSVSLTKLKIRQDYSVVDYGVVRNDLIEVNLDTVGQLSPVLSNN